MANLKKNYQKFQNFIVTNSNTHKKIPIEALWLIFSKKLAIPDFFQEFLTNFIQRKFQNSKFLV
jgi:hypothetical protein